jgi:hypothetical protein
MCPYIEKGDSRCLETLNLRNIENAISLCGSRYKDCPVYCRLRLIEKNLLRAEPLQPAYAWPS